MNLQKINLKFFMEKGGETPLSQFIPVFHHWIQQDKMEGLLIDVAEYTHVHQGPGVMLIAHEANYSVDETDGKRGMLYNQKRTPEKTAEEHLKTAFRRALKACLLLESEPETKGNLKFKANHFRIFINDRLAASYGPEARENFEKILKPFLDSLYGGASCLFLPEMDHRKQVGFEVKVEKAFEMKELLEKLKA